MQVALSGATGQVGSRILAELVRRGHHVAARASDVEDEPALARLLAGHDVAISAVRFAASDPRLLIEAVRASGVRRYLVVGGAGSLEAIPGEMRIDTPELPAAARAEAAAGLAFLGLLREVRELDWTFLSPSARFTIGD